MGNPHNDEAHKLPASAIAEVQRILDDEARLALEADLTCPATSAPCVFKADCKGLGWCKRSHKKLAQS